MAEGRRSSGRSTGRSTGRPIGARRREAEAVEIVTEEAKVVEAAGRFAHLRDAVGGLRTRAGSADIERWLLIAGAVLVPLGLVAILLGWRGASQTPYDFEQIPYVISGGLLGVGLVALGGFLYFGYWLTRMVREQREHADRVATALERMEELLGGGVASNGSVRAVRTSGRSASRGTGFVATPGGTMFHRPDCVVVEGKGGLRRVTGREKSMAPCGICDPLATDADHATGAA
ncbi:MAG: hypothetical protein HYU28_00845 [Actinobacteria bacterium]|nr:hypothetical protein [Actinomycetota bacterium]